MAPTSGTIREKLPAGSEYILEDLGLMEPLPGGGEVEKSINSFAIHVSQGFTLSEALIRQTRFIYKIQSLRNLQKLS